MSRKATRGVGIVQPSVSKSVRMREIERLTDEEQDQFIALLGQALERDLMEFVGNARPLGDLVYNVAGPFEDPLQGTIYVHTMVGNFRRAELPDGCRAYREFIQGNAPVVIAPTEFAPTVDP